MKQFKFKYARRTSYYKSFPAACTAEMQLILLCKIATLQNSVVSERRGGILEGEIAEGELAPLLQSVSVN